MPFRFGLRTPLYMLHVRQNTSNPMPGEILNAPAPRRSAAHAARILPRRLLYSIFARIGGSGLDTDAFETLRASYRGGFLGKAIAYGNRQNEIPGSLIHSLRWHPVRLISFLDRPYYYGAKKKYLDWITSRHLATGRYDMFHSWSGDCLRSLQSAKPDCCSTGGVLSKSINAPIFCSSYQRGPPRPFASAVSRKKNSSICPAGWMWSASSRARGRQNFALFLQAH